MKSLFEQMGGTYREENGYLIPNLTLLEEEQVEIGVWGQRHLNHIQKHCKPFYNKMLSEHKLYDYLLQLDRDAEDIPNRLVKQMSERENVTEKLKVDNQMEWVARMNNIRSRATDIVNHRYNLCLNDSGGRENILLAAVLLSDSYDHNHGCRKCALHRDDRGGRILH